MLDGIGIGLNLGSTELYRESTLNCRITVKGEIGSKQFPKNVTLHAYMLKGEGRGSPIKVKANIHN